MRRNRFLKGGMNQQAKNYSSAIEKILAGEVDYAFFCFPFSHFLFYALGKNLVEKGWFSSLNRFKSREKTNFFSNGLLKGSAFFEKINNRAIGGKRYLNLIMMVSKQK